VTLAVLALAAWTSSVAVGLILLWRWQRRPWTAWFHLATAALGLGCWVAFVAADRPQWLGWSVFGWLLVVNGLGDFLMVGGRRVGRRPYLAAARDVLSGRRPLATAHALLAPTTLVLVFVAALGV
jgi:hypothetical protein